MTTLRPMLAVKVDLDKLRFPVYASAKLDGVRAVVLGGKLFSRSMKLIPNHFVQEQARQFPEGLDGELIVGKPTAPDCYLKTVSGVMSREEEPYFTFWVFDFFHAGLITPYKQRLAVLTHIDYGREQHMYLLPQFLCGTLKELMGMETRFIDQGYEGLILRDPESFYKHGRSTIREAALLKLKRFKDSEAEVLGMEELQHNANEAFENELGLTSHTSHQENKEGMDTLGALIVKDIYSGAVFKIGRFKGWDMAYRKQVWDARHSVTRLIKYRFFPKGGKDKPRDAVCLGWRHKEDL